jgi:hypothetical protein
MIPGFVDDRTPPGERDVFSMLAAGPADWVAVHSLDLAPWNRGIRTEIDFVVIAPKTGILCIEVKSHDSISFHDDRWHPPEIRRSPFKQACDGSATFHRRLSELAPAFRDIPVVQCCIFPRSPFDLSPNLSVQPWELVDARAFRSFTTGEQFCGDLEKRMMLSISANAAIQPLERRLAANQIETMITCCVPVQKRRPELQEEIRRRELDAEAALRAQQKPILTLAELNDRVVITGGAGTGKTLIAMEVARRTATRGHRVALLCFNALVGNWMRDRVSRFQPALPNLIAGRAIQVMAEMAQISIPANPAEDFWEIELPRMLEDRLTDPEFKADALFDYMVIDEAQDVLARPQLWDCLTGFLRGGVSSGSFILLGDFEHQVLAEREILETTVKRLDGQSKPVRWRLDENCRNYRFVAETAVRLSGFSRPVYTGYMRTGGSVENYDIFFYERDEEQINILDRWLREFRARGYRSSDITVLSFRSPESSVACRLARRPGVALRPAWKAAGGSAYTSVHAFKGMENKIIILTDVLLGDHEFHRDLFYTGMTRAIESVRVLCDKRSRDRLLEWAHEGDFHA